MPDRCSASSLRAIRTQRYRSALAHPNYSRPKGKALAAAGRPFYLFHHLKVETRKIMALAPRPLPVTQAGLGTAGS